MTKAGPYDLFKNNEELEKKGVELRYGDSFYITVARAGGTNKRYVKAFEAKTRPHRRQIQAGTLDDATDRRIMAEVYADTVVLGWGKYVLDEDSGEFVAQNGVIPGPDGQDLAFNRDNVVKLFLDLPDLFADVVENSTKLALFRDDALEGDAKN